jgi:hypothetical protein
MTLQNQPSVFGRNRAMLASLVVTVALLTVHSGYVSRLGLGPRLTMDAAAQGISRVTVTLYDPMVEWYGAPNTIVSGFVSIDGFREGVSMQTTSDEQGRATLEFTLDGACTLCPHPDRLLIPGAELAIIAQGAATPKTISIPNVAGDIDFETDRIGGIGPIDEVMRLQLEDATGQQSTIERDVTVGSDGRFLVIFEDERDILASDSGTIEFEDGKQNRFIGRLEVPRIQARVGKQLGCTQLRDEMIRTHLYDPDGQPKPSGCDGGDEVVSIGDTVEIERGTGFLVPDALPTVRMVVPDVQALIDSGSDTLIGTAPPGLELLARTRSAFSPLSETRLISDARGEFSLPLPTAAARDVELVSNGDNGISAHFDVVETSILIGINNGVVSARLGPSAFGDAAVVGAELHDSTAQFKADVLFTSEPGWQEMSWGGDWDLEAGEVIEPKTGDLVKLLDVNDGVTTVEVPRLDFDIDLQASRISGVTRPGAMVVATFAGDYLLDPSMDPQSVRADEQGEFDIDRDVVGRRLRPGDWGTVAVLDAQTGLGFYSIWSLPQLELNVVSGRLYATASPGEQVEVVLRDQLGAISKRETATSVALVPLGEVRRVPSRPRWTVSLSLSDRGAIEPLTVGDSIEIHYPDHTRDIVIPRLSSIGDAERDQVLVDTDLHFESARLRIQTPRVGDPTHRGQVYSTQRDSPGSGSFVLDVASEFDLRLGDLIETTLVTSEGIEFGHFLQLPSFTLDSVNGWLTGEAIQVVPGSAITATLTRNGEPYLQSQGEAGLLGQGQFLVRLREPSGALPTWTGGELLEVEFEGHPSLRSRMSVPRIEANVDWQQEWIRGQVAAEGLLEARVGSQYIFYPELDVDGRFDEAVQRPLSSSPWAAPGNGLQLSLYLPSGMTVGRRFIYPRVSIEHSGLRVDAMVEPLAEAVASLIDSQGGVLASTSGQAREYWSEPYEGDSTSNLHLAFDSDQLVDGARPGDIVRVVIGDVEIEVEVPEFELEVDWSDGSLAGRVRPGATMLRAKQGDKHCVPEPGFSWEAPSATRSWGPSRMPTADGSFAGQFGTIFGPGPVPGYRYMLGLDTLEGHRVYRTFSVASLTLDWQNGRLSGCAQPLEDVVAVLANEGGVEKARVQVRADAQGRYSIELIDAEGAPTTLYPTDSLEVCSFGKCSQFELLALPEAELDGASLRARSLRPDSRAFVQLAPRRLTGPRPFPQLDGWEDSRWYPWTLESESGTDGGIVVTNDALADAFLPWRLEDVDAAVIWNEVDPGMYLSVRIEQGALLASLYLPRLSKP